MYAAKVMFNEWVKHPFQEVSARASEEKQTKKKKEGNENMKRNDSQLATEKEAKADKSYSWIADQIYKTI